MPTYSTARYHLAPSLVALFNEINARWPNRDKASDGWIGDTAHSARVSDHNPDWAVGGVVRAIDVDKDGINVDELLEAVVRDHRVWYVIWNRRIASSTDDGTPWDWEPYNGSNPHDKHVHISIKHTRAAETDTGRWFTEDEDEEAEVTEEQMRRAVKLGTLDALREYGRALFKDEEGTADTLWDESRENQKALLAAINANTEAVKALRGQA